MQEISYILFSVSMRIIYKEEELIKYLEEGGFKFIGVERDKDRLGRSELSWLITFSRKD